jgi:PEP-CTERM motif
MTVTGTLQVWNHGNVNISGTVARVGGLSIATSGLVNINSALLITSDGGDPTAAETAIQDYIEGGQITSSFVNSNSGYGIAYADGSDPGLENSNLTAGQVVIEPDLDGDADLSGTVAFHDLQILLGNFGQPGFWDQGNFNNHSTVDFNDLQLLLGNFNGSATLSYSELSGIEELVGQYGFDADPNSNGVGFTLVAVPEPSSIILTLAGFGLLARRRARGRRYGQATFASS